MMDLHNAVLDAILAAPTAQAESASLRDRLFQTRALSSELARPLSDEDQVVQANDDASPTKWHLAHTTWFFEAFLLKRFLAGYRVFDERFEYCFNSYYESVGSRQPRGKRGLLTRPSAEEVRAYRAHIDVALGRLFDQALSPEAAELVELGINHEQQHQELLLTDIKHVLSVNPIAPCNWIASRVIRSAASDARAFVRLASAARGAPSSPLSRAWTASAKTAVASSCCR